MKTKLFFWLTLISVSVFGQVTLIDDPLTGNTKGGTQVGGTFSLEGYQPGASNNNQNHILYVLPEQVNSGYLEFEIKGMTKNGGSATDSEYDPAFCGMYDGRGFVEPMKYFDDFKSNFFRWNVHWRGDKKAIKAVINCAAPTSERLNATKAIFANDVRDWFSEPTGQSVEWDPAKWHKIKVEWKETSFKVYIDGIVKWSTTGKYEYVPVQHKVWIGCAPGYSKKYTATVPGLTFRNVKLVSNRDASVPVKYNLSVSGGSGSGFYESGSSVTIIASAPPVGKIFDKWSGSVLAVADIYSDTTVLTMPSGNVSLTATYKQILYKLSVNDGIGSGSYAQGTIVNITANAAPNGKVFDKWTGDISSIADISKKTISISMPSKNIILTATYKNADAIFIDDNDVENIALYPNPCVDHIILNKGLVDEITILDLNGVIRIHRENISGAIDVSSLMPGCYLVKVHVENTAITRLFIKQ